MDKFTHCGESSVTLDLNALENTLAMAVRNARIAFDRTTAEVQTALEDSSFQRGKDSENDAIWNAEYAAGQLPKLAESWHDALRAYRFIRMAQKAEKVEAVK